MYKAENPFGNDLLEGEAVPVPPRLHPEIRSLHVAALCLSFPSSHTKSPTGKLGRAFPSFLGRKIPFPVRLGEGFGGEHSSDAAHCAGVGLQESRGARADKLYQREI